MPEHNHQNCGHHSAAGLSDGRLRLSIAATLLFVVGEMAVGFHANSLALLSDAGHNFTDGLALALSWYAMRVASRPPDASRTYGYRRVGILTALANALTLIVIAALIGWEGILRLIHPQPANGPAIACTAAVALALNTVIALALRSSARNSINMKGAYLHMAGDAVASVGVIAAGLIIRYTGLQIADPIVSLIIAAIIARSSWGLIQETVNVLLEGAPAGIDVNALADNVLAIEGVSDLHDLHLWTIGDGMNALSCHLIVKEEDAERAGSVVQSVKRLLAERYQVGHSVIETECGGCDLVGLHCSIHEDAHMHEHSHEDGPVHEH